MSLPHIDIGERYREVSKQKQHIGITADMIKTPACLTHTQKTHDIYTMTPILNTKHTHVTDTHNKS